MGKMIFGPGGNPGAKLLEVSLTDVTNTSGSYSGNTSDPRVTTDMKPVLIELGNPEVFLDKITVTASNGFVTLACPSVAGTSTVKVTLQKVMTDTSLIGQTEFDVLAGRIGDLTSLTTTAKTSVVEAVNELVSNKQDKTDNSLNTTAKTVIGAINEHESDISTLNNNLTTLSDNTKVLCHKRNINALFVTVPWINTNWSCGLFIANINGFGNNIGLVNFAGSNTGVVTYLLGNSSGIMATLNNNGTATFTTGSSYSFAHFTCIGL